MVTYVLIPPLGHDSQFYTPLKKLLSSYEVVCLDYPYLDAGFAWTEGDLIEKLAQYFASKLEGHQRVEIMGVSLGATISMRIKEILGEKINHLHLISSGGHKVASFRKEMILAHLRDLGPREFLLKSLEVGSSEEFTNSDFKSHFHQTQIYAQDYWDYYTKKLWSPENIQQASLGLCELVRASVEVNFEHLIERFQDHLSIIWADQDKVFSMRFYEKFKSRAPRARFYLLQNVGHFSPLETPERILHILEGYEKPTSI